MSLEAFLRESIYQYTIAANGESNFHAVFSATPLLIGDFERLLESGTAGPQSTVDISCLLEEASSGPVLETLLKVLFGEKGYQAKIDRDKPPPVDRTEFEQEKFNALWLQNQAKAVASRLNRLRESNNQVTLTDLITVLLARVQMPALKTAVAYRGPVAPPFGPYPTLPPEYEDKYKYLYQLSDYPDHKPTKTAYDALIKKVSESDTSGSDVKTCQGKLRMMNADMLEIGSVDGICALALIYYWLEYAKLISDFPKVSETLRLDSGQDLRERFKAVIKEGKIRAEDITVIFSHRVCSPFYARPPFVRKPLVQTEQQLRQVAVAAEEGYLQDFLKVAVSVSQEAENPWIDPDDYFEMARQGNAHQYYKLMRLLTHKGFLIDSRWIWAEFITDPDASLTSRERREIAINAILREIKHTACKLSPAGFHALYQQILTHHNQKRALVRRDLTEFTEKAFAVHATASTETAKTPPEAKNTPTPTQSKLIPDTPSYEQQIQRAIDKCDFLSEEQREYLLEKAKIADTPPRFPHIIRVGTGNKLEVEKVKKLLEILNNNHGLEEKKKALHTAASINTGLWSEHQEGIGKYFTSGSSKFPSPK